MASALRPKLLYVVPDDWYFCSHRLVLAQAAQQAGYEVWVATRVDQHGALIRGRGLNLFPIRMHRSSLGVVNQLQTVNELVGVYRRLRPDIVHHVAMKPVIYGSVAAYLTRVPAVVNAIAGLGFVFSSDNLRAQLLRPLVRLAFRSVLGKKRSRLIVQNPDDARLFANQFRTLKDRICMIRGSGVDVASFQPLPEPNGIPTVALVARMLRDKGIVELVESARILRERGLRLRVILAGWIDHLNPSHLEEQEIRAWESDALVEWWGEVGDVREVWKQAHIAALPSYREGLPKSLLEAAACGRAIVATDTPGCREIVRHEKNGLLVPVRDSKALANALQTLIEAAALRIRMGARGREIVVAEFAQERIIAETLAVYETLLHEGKSRNNLRQN